MVTAEFSGPLPPPGLLRASDEVMPGLAERIAREMETNAIHRRAFETKRLDTPIRMVDRDHEQRRLGQIFAFVICLTAIVGGCVVAATGHQWAGGAIGAGGLASVITAFVWGRKHPEPPADKPTGPRRP